MTILRDKNTTPHDFRRVLRELTFYLGYEATRSVKTTDVEIETPLMTTTGKKIGENVAIIPILRAGLGMCDAMLELLPKAAVHHIGKLTRLLVLDQSIHPSLIHPLTHSLIHSLTHSLTHTLAYNTILYRHVSIQNIAIAYSILQPIAQRT